MQKSLALSTAAALLLVACADVSDLSSREEQIASDDQQQQDEQSEMPGETMTNPAAGAEATTTTTSDLLPAPVTEYEEKKAPPSGIVKGALTTKTFTSGIVAVYDDGVWMASFTKGARTVRVVGKERTLRDPTEGANGGGVTHDEHIRLYPSAFTSFGDAEKKWLADRRSDSSADILEMSTEYFDGKSLDAKYVFGNDYDDYAGSRGIDCSGFVRLIYAKRTQPSLLSNGLLPRVAMDQLNKATGVLTIANKGKQPSMTDLERLRPGDLVFFDVSSRNDGVGGIDHVGFYVGHDKAGNMRFVNSTPNNGAMTGPTMQTKFVLDGSTFWATHFRGARRL